MQIKVNTIPPQCLQENSQLKAAGLRSVQPNSSTNTLSKLRQWRRARTILASVRRVNQVLLSEILSSAQD